MKALVAGETKPDAKTHTVTFHTEHGVAVRPQTVNDGEKAAESQMPDIEGWHFTGWQLATGVAYDFDSPVTADLNLYAVWTSDGFAPAGTHNVYFTSDGLDLSALSSNIADGMPVPVPDDPVSDGYRFIGWADRSNGRRYDFSKPVSDEVPDNLGDMTASIDGKDVEGFDPKKPSYEIDPVTDEVVVKGTPEQYQVYCAAMDHSSMRKDYQYGFLRYDWVLDSSCVNKDSTFDVVMHDLGGNHRDWTYTFRLRKKADNGSAVKVDDGGDKALAQTGASELSLATLATAFLLAGLTALALGLDRRR